MDFLTDRTLLWFTIVAILVLSILEYVQDPASKKYSLTILILSGVAVALSTYYQGFSIITQGLFMTAPSAVANAVANASQAVNIRTDLARQNLVSKSFAARLPYGQGR